MNSSESPTPARTCCGDDCCSTPLSSESAVALASPTAAQQDAVRQHVRAGYSRIAQNGPASAPIDASPSCGCSTGSAGGCCGPSTLSAGDLAAAIGYGEQDLAAMPQGANMGLSCGNPTAIAALKPGQVVLDLGSGGGFDCFVAGPRVGPTGRVIGVDMTPDMVSKARANIASYSAQSGLDNVEFRLGEIENLPVATGSVDVVISNCVLNLSPDKPRVWREIARVLKPGGRVAISDLALLQPLPETVQKDIEALVGCIAGAALVDQTHRMIRQAGLEQISLSPKPRYIDAMTNWQDPLYQRIARSLPLGSSPGDFITSLDVTAVKPN